MIGLAVLAVAIGMGAWALTSVSHPGEAAVFGGCEESVTDSATLSSVTQFGCGGWSCETAAAATAATGSAPQFGCGGWSCDLAFGAGAVTAAAGGSAAQFVCGEWSCPMGASGAAYQLVCEIKGGKFPKMPIGNPCNPEPNGEINFNGVMTEIYGPMMQIVYLGEGNNHAPHPAPPCFPPPTCIGSVASIGGIGQSLNNNNNEVPHFVPPVLHQNNQLFTCGPFTVFIQGNVQWHPALLHYGIFPCTVLGTPAGALCVSNGFGPAVAGVEAPAGPFVANGSYYDLTVTDSLTGLPITTLPARVFIELEDPYQEPLRVFLYDPDGEVWEELSDFSVEDGTLTIEAPRLGVFAVVSSPPPVGQTAAEADQPEIVVEESEAGAKAVPADEPGVLSVVPGREFVRYEGADTSASALFSDAKIAWLWDEQAGRWLACIPQLDSGDFTLHSGALLWVTTYERGTPLSS